MRFERSGRSWRAFLALVAFYVVVIGAWLFLEAAGWIVTALLVLSLSAAYDFALGRGAGMVLDDNTFHWFSGRLTGDVALDLIDHVRLSRRLDLSTRVALVTTDGKRIRLPQEALPPVDSLAAALEAAGVRIERHPFSLS